MSGIFDTPVPVMGEYINPNGDIYSPSSNQAGWMRLGFLIVFVLIVVWTFNKDNTSGFLGRSAPNAGSLGAGKLGFSSVYQTSKFAPTPYPYPADCGVVEDQMTYALQVAKDNSGDAYSDQRYQYLFPTWTKLLQSYMLAKKDSLANPADSGLANKAAAARATMLQFEDANGFHPYSDEPLTPEKVQATEESQGASSTEAFLCGRFMPQQTGRFANPKWRPFRNGPAKWRPFLNGPPQPTGRFTNGPQVLNNPGNSNNPGMAGGSLIPYSTVYNADNVASQTTNLGSNDAAPLSDEGLMVASYGLLYPDEVFHTNAL